MEENWDYQPEQLINDIKPIPLDILQKCLEKKQRYVKY